MMLQLKNKAHQLTACPVLKLRIEDFSPETIRQSGQTFRFNEVEPGLFEVISRDRRLFFRRSGDDEFTFYCTRKDFKDYWTQYFDLDTDYQEINRRIDPEDDFLNRARDYSSGMRILRQDPWEMTITFLLAQRKGLKAIQTAVEKLSQLCGSEMTDCAGSFYAFPTPEQLASLSVEQLESCGLGYRTPYIRTAAERIANGSFSLKEVKNLDNRSARDLLKTLPGVGDKIADCILLFGFQRLDVFPVDIWIEKCQNDFYDGRFPTDQYEGINGVLQQYLFHYSRNHHYKNQPTIKVKEKEQA